MEKRKLKYLLPIAIIILSILLTVIIIMMKPEIEPEAQEITAVQVRVMKVIKQDIQMVVNSQGTVHAKTESEIVAQVSGVIEAVSSSFVAGGFFKKGEVLVRLDARDYQYRYIQAQHKVTQAELALKLEEQQAEIASDEWKQMNEGPPPALVSRDPQLAEAAASLESARASLLQAQLDLDRTKVRAPFSGRLKVKNVDRGRYVTPGMSLARIYSIDVAEVRLPIPDKDLKYLDLPRDFRLKDNPGHRPEVILSGDFAGSKHQWTGNLTHIEGELDARSRMIHAAAQVPDPYGKKHEVPLTAGMYVKAEIIGKKVSNLVVVPREVLRGQNQILIVDKENHLYTRKIGIYRIEGESVYIDSGLENGELVCLSQLKTVVEGMDVSPVAEAEEK